MMTTDTATNVDALLAEQSGIRAKIERAAVEGDTAAWLEHRMRADALPRLIKNARSGPLKARLERLDKEIDATVEELERAQHEPHPEVPPHLRGGVSPVQLHQARLQSIAGRQASAGKDRKELLARLAEIEGSAP